MINYKNTLIFNVNVVLVYSTTYFKELSLSVEIGSGYFNCHKHITNT